MANYTPQGAESPSASSERKYRLEQLQSEIDETKKFIDDAQRDIDLASFQESLLDYSDADRIRDSFSISHRTLICAALSKGESEITGVLECEDIDATTDALTALGAEIRTENGVTYVRGIENVPSYAEINCRESGSTLRFMMPVCAALGVETVFTGSGKLPTRPVTPYLDQFPKHGVEFISDTFPYHIKGKLTSGVYPVTGDISSQFITG